MTLESVTALHQWHLFSLHKNASSLSTTWVEALFFFRGSLFLWQPLADSFSVLNNRQLMPKSGQSKMLHTAFLSSEFIIMTASAPDKEVQTLQGSGNPYFKGDNLFDMQFWNACCGETNTSGVQKLRDRPDFLEGGQSGYSGFYVAQSAAKWLTDVRTCTKHRNYVWQRGAQAYSGQGPAVLCVHYLNYSCSCGLTW